MATAPRPAAAIAAAGAAVYGAALLLAVDPFDGPVLCPMRRMTGLHCPGCGSTRAAWLVLHGDVGGALRHNLLLLPLGALLLARWLHLAAPARTGWLPGWIRVPTTAPRAAVVALAAVVASFGVLRNLPALDWLAPPT